VSQVPLEKVERELARLWEEEAQKTQASRVELLTVAALVSEERLLDRAKDVLAQVATAHPSRTIAATWSPGTTPRIDCDVSLHRNASRKNEACGDQIVLQAHGEARWWLPENFDRLALSDLPYCVWWVGDLPDHDRLFDEAIQHADVVVVNSAEMDLRDIEKLSQIAHSSHGTYALLDLTWVRLRGMLDLVARFFDDPGTLPYLAKLRRVTFTYSPRPNEQDVCSTRVGLVLGWLAQQLGLDPGTARWTRDGRGGELAIGRAGSSKAVTIRVNQEKMEGAHDGAITRIEMACDGPNGEGRFDLVREGPALLKWSVDAPGVTIPSQTLRFGSHDEAKLLARQLERPSHDALFEASLYAGYRIVQQVAPRLSEPPPPPH
jgi:glucose-6-phosphate dehydrogenase assembly protein OpcA